MNKISILLASLVSILLLNSCASPSVDSSTTPSSNKNTCIITTSISNAQKKKIQSYAQSKFGGFASGPWGATGVSNIVLLSLNQKFGPERYYDGRGSYNNKWNGAFREEVKSGRLVCLGRIDHYQIPTRYYDNISFNAIAGHEYFVGAILDEVSADFRWIPVVYDKTTNQVIDVKGLKIKNHPKPITIYL